MSNVLLQLHIDLRTLINRQWRRSRETLSFVDWLQVSGKMDEENLEMLAEELTSCAVCTNKYFEEDDDGIKRVSLLLS